MKISTSSESFRYFSSVSSHQMGKVLVKFVFIKIFNSSKISASKKTNILIFDIIIFF